MYRAPKTPSRSTPQNGSIAPLLPRTKGEYRRSSCSQKGIVSQLIAYSHINRGLAQPSAQVLFLVHPGVSWVVRSETCRLLLREGADRDRPHWLLANVLQAGKGAPQKTEIPAATHPARELKPLKSFPEYSFSNILQKLRSAKDPLCEPLTSTPPLVVLGNS